MGRRGCAGRTPWREWWLAQSCSCQGSVPLLLLLPAGLLLPAPACSSLGTGGWKTRLCRGSAACSCPASTPEISWLGFPQSHQPVGHPGASRRPQVEVRGCQRPRARGSRGSGCEGLRRGCSCRGWARRAALVTDLAPASKAWETPRGRGLKDKCCN